MPHIADIESLTVILGFLATVVAAWWRATTWVVRFVAMHETLNGDIKRISSDVAILVDQMHELAQVVRQTERDTERLESRFDTLNGKYPKN